MMKYLLTAFCVFLISTAAVAQQRPDKAMAVEYLKLSKMEEATNETIKGFDETMFKNMSPKERKEIRNLLIQTMGWDVVKNELADLVMNIYTKEEISASIKFMKTPVGASAMAKNGEFSKQYSGVVSAKLEAALKKCCSAQK